MTNKPFKLTVKQWDKKTSIEKDYSDVNINELHDMWISMVKAIGFSANTIKEFYDE